MNSKSKNRNLKLCGIVVLSGVFLFLATPALAICEGPIVPCGGCLEFDPTTHECIAPQADCQFCHLFLLIANILNFVLTCLVPIAGGLMFVIGGIMLMFSYFSEAEILQGGAKGGPALFSRARKAITATVIGIAIIFLAWVFLNQLLVFMDYQDWTGLGTWWEFTEKCPIR